MKDILDVIIKSNDYMIPRYQKMKAKGMVNIVNAKKPVIPFPCNYHDNEFLEQSKECKDSFICNKCKEENIVGRDGIYGMEELLSLMQERLDKSLKERDPNEKIAI